jgi:hypothetical protein
MWERNEKIENKRRGKNTTKTNKTTVEFSPTRNRHYCRAMVGAGDLVILTPVGQWLFKVKVLRG